MSSRKPPTSQIQRWKLKSKLLEYFEEFDWSRYFKFGSPTRILSTNFFASKDFKYLQSNSFFWRIILNRRQRSLMCNYFMCFYDCFFRSFLHSIKTVFSFTWWNLWFLWPKNKYKIFSRINIFESSNDFAIRRKWLFHFGKWNEFEIRTNFKFTIIFANRKYIPYFEIKLREILNRKTIHKCS